MTHGDVNRRLLAGLNTDQAAAVTHLSGPLLVVAGPGSGKTAVLTRRVAALVDVGVPPRRIAAVTFTNRAAAEMRDRLHVLAGDATAGATVATFHSLCARLLRRHYRAAGLPASFTIADSRDSAAVMAAAGADAGLFGDMSGKEVSRLVRDARRIVSAAKNAGVGAAADWTPPPGEELTPKLWRAYEKALAASGMVDFDDLLTKVAALGRDADVGPVLAGLFDRFLVDEYQDTNRVQQQLTELFAGPDGQVCAVGDPDQSVYAFRGATGAVADVFVKRWPAARVITLGCNYRSTSTIVAVSAAVIAANPATHRAVPSPRPQAPTGAPVTMMTAADPDAEAAWAAAVLVGKQASAPPGFTAAILVRANHQTRALERALTAAGVRHALLGALRFADRAEVKDAMAWLRLVVNPHDQVAAARAAAVPRRGMGDAAVSRLRAAMFDGVDVVAAARQVAAATPRAAKAANSFADDVSRVAAAAAGGGVAAALDVALHRVGVLRAAVGTGDGAADREANLSELVSFAATFPHSDPAGAQLGDFCEALSLASSDAAGAVGDGDPPPVVVATIHAAKGKEFDWVMVAGCEEGVLPHALSTSTGQVAEERRLMFVACSRARHELVLSRCVERDVFGKRTAADPSRFLDDVPAELAQQGSVGGRRPGPGRGGPRPPTVPGRHFTPGQPVYHRLFGAGRVVAHDRGVGQVTVQFPGSAAKVFADSTPALNG